MMDKLCISTNVYFQRAEICTNKQRCRDLSRHNVFYTSHDCNQSANQKDSLYQISPCFISFILSFQLSLIHVAQETVQEILCFDIKRTHSTYSNIQLFVNCFYLKILFITTSSYFTKDYNFTFITLVELSLVGCRFVIHAVTPDLRTEAKQLK